MQRTKTYKFKKDESTLQRESSKSSAMWSKKLSFSLVCISLNRARSSSLSLVVILLLKLWPLSRAFSILCSLPGENLKAGEGGIFHQNRIPSFKDPTIISPSFSKFQIVTHNNTYNWNHKNIRIKPKKKRLFFTSIGLDLNFLLRNWVQLCNSSIKIDFLVIKIRVAIINSFSSSRHRIKHRHEVNCTKATHQITNPYRLQDTSPLIWGSTARRSAAFVDYFGAENRAHSRSEP